MGRSRIVGWTLDRADRERLLRRYPPRYPRVVADHVTFGKADEAPSMPDHDRARVVGRADDGEGVEALVVALGGGTGRWDGSTYHVTWSLAHGREPVESNAVIQERGWEAIEDGPEMGLKPAEWP